MPYPLFLWLKIDLIFLFHMYHLNPGLSTISKNLFNRANFERLGMRAWKFSWIVLLFQIYFNKTWYEFQGNHKVFHSVLPPEAISYHIP